VILLYKNPISSFCKARKKLAREEEEEEADERRVCFVSLARARLFMFINVPCVYRFAVSLSFLSRDNDTDLRQLSRNRGFKWT